MSSERNHDPLDLGRPLGQETTSSPATQEHRNLEAESQLSPITESKSSATPSRIGSSPPQLIHTRTAPTTFPIHPVAHQGFAAHHESHGLPAIHDHEQEEDSMGPLREGGHVPLEAGGLHGMPMPGSRARQMGEAGISEKDRQAGTTGSTGATTDNPLAEKAAIDLGLGTNGHSQRQTKARSNTLNEKMTPPPTFANIGRTATGTRISRNVKTGGRDTVQGYGMMPIVRQASLPPAVGPFGGTAPTGVDAEEGLWAVRSHEEELARQKTMDKNGPDPFAVKFVPGDKENPKNWGTKYRWWLTTLAGILVLNSTFASSAPSGVVTDLQAEFGFSREVGVLTIALFVAGYMLGPLLWGPLSEIVGRRPVFIGTFIAYVGFQVGCALAPNTGALLAFRFLGGTFAAAPLTNSGALLADIWEGDHRGQAMSIFSLSPFAGPAFGPIVAGYISVSGTSWRWVFWVTTIFASVCLIFIIFAVPETYAPALLVRKARRIRQETGDERYYAPMEKAERNVKEFLSAILLKPFIMLALEPMLLATTLYMSYIYGIVYLLFEAFPFVFVVNHGFNVGENGLCFLGFFSGGVICVIFFITIIEPRYLKYAHKVAPQMPQPEKRLELCIISGWTLVIAMFWFGWTSYASIHWISPILAGALIGFSVLGMFVSLFNYVIDTYLWSAASALAGMTVVRSAFGAGFPLFASQMYEKLGTQWASSLLGFLALVMAPIPMVLFIYGPKLRARSRYSPSL